MHKFVLVVVLLIISQSTAHALDLSISNPIVTDLEISLSASLSATSNYYLQGAMRAQSSSKYFGETKNVRGDWIDYVSSPDKEYITSNFFQTDVQNASWSGIVKLRFKLDDPNYLGPGLYDLKLRRFTGQSSGSAGESNTLTLNLTAQTPSPSAIASASPSPSPSLIPSPHSSFKPSPIPSPSLSGVAEEGTIAGVTTEINLEGFGQSLLSPAPSPAASPSPGLTLNRARAKSAVLIGLGLILTSLSSFLIYRRYLSLHGDSA
jgi:hypothetical protein